MSSLAITPMIAGLGPTEVIIIIAVLVLLFGAKKLPELARGSGRALRIFKAETKGLMDDDDVVPETKKTEEQRQLDAQLNTMEARYQEEQRRAATEHPNAEHPNAEHPDTER